MTHERQEAIVIGCIMACLLVLFLLFAGAFE